MKRNHGKLVLNVETIRRLTDEEAASVVGGKPFPPGYSEYCSPCDGGGPTNSTDPGICQGPTTQTGGCTGGPTDPPCGSG